MKAFISASINLNKIDNKRLFSGKAGDYLNIVIIVNEEPDQYGKDVVIQQSVEKGEPKIHLGTGKVFQK